MKNADLVASVSLAFLMMPIAFFTSGPLRTVLGMAFVLFLPGYTVVAALFPRRADLSGPERLAYSMGLSLALVPLVAMLLNFTPWGIAQLPIAISLALVIVGTATWALYRRLRVSQNDAWSLRPHRAVVFLRERWRSERPLNRVLVTVFALSCLGFVATLVYAVVTPRVSESFTEFYVLDPAGRTESYPQRLGPGQEAMVTLGVVNREQKPETYRVEVLLDGDKISEISPFQLDNQGRWQQDISFRTFSSGGRQMLQFLLYQGESGQLSRSLHLWIDASGPS